MLRSISGALHDGPVWRAKVYVDVNGNREVDNGDVLVDKETDRFGNYSGEIPEQFRGLPLVADNTDATHLEGSLNDDGTPVVSSQKLPDYLATPAGATVISPLTHIITIWPSMDNPLRQSIESNPLFTGYDPLQDNIFDPRVEVTYEALIKEFMVDLTGLIIKYRYKAQLGDAVSNLLREYANRLKEPLPLTRDEGLQPAEDGPVPKLADSRVELRENSDVGVILYRVGVPAARESGNRVHLWVDGADADDFTVTQRGELRLKAPADYEVKQHYQVTIKAREVARDAPTGTDRSPPPRAGPDVADAQHRVTVIVLDIHDEAPAFDSADGYMATVAENSAVGTALVSVKATAEVVDGAETQPRVSYSLTANDDGALPQWLADLVAIDRTTGAVTLRASPDFDTLKTQDGVRVDEVKGELHITFNVVATATHGDRVLVTHSPVTLTVVDLNDEAPRFVNHGPSRIAAKENAEMAALLAILVGESPPEEFRGLQVHDPDIGDEVTLSLVSGKDALLFELVETGNGRFSLMWKAGSDGRRLVPDFERGPGNNYRVSHDDDGVFEVDIVARDSEGREVIYSFEVDILDNSVEMPSLEVVRTPGQTGPIRGPKNVKLSASGKMYLGGDDPAQPLTLSVRFGDRSAAPMRIQLDPVMSDKNYRIGELVLSHQQLLDFPSFLQQRAIEYKGTLYEISDAMPPGGYVFYGQYGAITISPNRMLGHLNTLKWEYEAYTDYGSGSPFNRIGPDRTATETITFIVDEGARQRTQTLSLDLVGNYDFPVIVSETGPDGGQGGFLPDPDARPWAWWQDKFIFIKSSNRQEVWKYISVEPGQDRSIWQFLAVDEDGAYFQPRGADGGGTSDYGPVGAFVGKYIRFSGYYFQLPRYDPANMFEIVQATDEDGAPRFVPLPGDATKQIPVLELRFKPNFSTVPGRNYELTLNLLDDLTPDDTGRTLSIHLTINVPRERVMNSRGNGVGERNEMTMSHADDAPTWQPNDELPPLQAELV